MNFKVFVTVFIGLLAVNLSVQSPALKDDSIKIIVVEVVDAILNATNQLLTEANALVDQIEKDEGGIKDGVVAFLDRVGKDVNAFVLRVIDELRNGATADGNAIIDCIDAEKDKTEAAFDQVFESLGTCALNELPKILAEARSILGELGDLQNDVQGQTDTLSACTDTELACLTAYGTTLVATIQKVIPIIKTDVQQVIDLINTIYSEVRICNGDIGKNLGAAIQDLFNEAVVCIKG